MIILILQQLDTVVHLLLPFFSIVVIYLFLLDTIYRLVTVGVCLH